LVASDLGEAVTVAYGGKGQGKAKFRVVTLKGELIDQSGTMSGGGKARKVRDCGAVGVG
jgi:structural maintenance of chromosome 4